MRKFARSLIAVALIAGCIESLSPEDIYGVWGGEGARLTLSNTQALFETSCWAGELAIPVQIHADRFTAIGNVHSQGGAGGTATVAVILTGRLSGDVLHLTVETSFPLGPFRLERGAQASIPGCP